MGAKKYFFYISDPKLQRILDELKRNRMLSDIVTDALEKGLEQQIKKRVKRLEKLGGMYKK